MRLATLTVLSLSTLAACVVYDTECGPGYDDTRITYGSGEEETEPNFFLTPNEVDPGDTLIVSLTSDEAVDFAGITDIGFYGDVSICTTSLRDSELLMTLVIDASAQAGDVTMFIEMWDGTTIYVDAALTIMSDGSPDDGSGAGDDGTGAGDDGTGAGDDPVTDPVEETTDPAEEQTAGDDELDLGTGACG